MNDKAVDPLTQELLHWQVGAVLITRAPEYEWSVPGEEFIPGARLEALRRHPWLFPNFVSAEGGLRMSVHVLLIQTGDLRVVVDTCFGKDKNLPHLAQLDGQGEFLDWLASVGFTRENVDVVLCTHLHIDHVGWNTMMEEERWVPTFPNARYLMDAEEYAFLTSGHENLALHGASMVLRDSVQPIIDAGLADFVPTDYRLSPELRLVPTPGHTSGHVSVMIKSEGETAVITGDMMHHPCQIAHPEWTNQFDADPERNVATRRKMLRQWQPARHW